ncbi:hypothetical protein CASFOL_029911 [Castilleja foliolosa]|uniref:rRNA-processing protein EFG1 n=1 Tax=Castilleja foliolosa TaxID=1961234 RepID=A0ABD3C9W0_9LAMI
MAHGERRVTTERKKPARRAKALTVDNKSKTSKPKAVSLKNQMRSTERMLRKDLPIEVKEVLETKLEGLKKQQEIQNCLSGCGAEDIFAEHENKFFCSFQKLTNLVAAATSGKDLEDPMKT